MLDIASAFPGRPGFSTIHALLAMWRVLLVLAPGAARAAELDRPNVVLIVADDMGWGDLAVQNPASKIPTPNLDQLAHEGGFGVGPEQSAIIEKDSVDGRE